MAFTNDFASSRNWRTWQSDPSTRTAVQPFDRYVALSGSVGTSAADAVKIYAGPYYNLDVGGVTTSNWELATTGSPGLNRILNPSIENATISEFTADGSAISRTTGAPLLGSAELTANPANSAAKEGFYVTTEATGSAVNISGNGTGAMYLVASGHVRGASASGDAVIQITDSSGNVLVTSDAVSLTTDYQRLDVAYAIPAIDSDGNSSRSYRVKFCSNTQHNINMLWDALSYDFRDNSTKVDYIDGNLAGGNGYEWEGTTDLSKSRHVAPISVIRYIKIKNTHGSQNLFVAFDAEAEATANCLKLAAGESFESSHPIDFRKKVSVIGSGSSTTFEGIVMGTAISTG